MPNSSSASVQDKPVGARINPLKQGGSARGSALQGDAAQLSRRDLVILPLLSLLTVLVIVGAAEITSRIVWRSQVGDACLVRDPVLGHRYQPNCTSSNKLLEGPWVTYHYNACGYRTDADCGPKPAGTLRVAWLGSSVAAGLAVPTEETAAEVAKRSIDRNCHRPVQIENMASMGYEGDVLDRQLDEVIALRPDAATFMISPFDLGQNGMPAGGDEDANKPPREFLARVKHVLNFSRAVEVAQHFMQENVPRSVSLYLLYGDRADFLRQPLTPAWQARLDTFEDLLVRLDSRLRAEGIPLVLVYSPSRAQAALSGMSDRPANVDPFVLDRAVGEIARRHGIPYTDGAIRFGQLDQPAAYFYPADGHLSANGQHVMGEVTSTALEGLGGAFSGCAVEHPGNVPN